LTTAQVSQGLTTGQVVALTTAQGAALTTAGIASLTTAQLVALRTDQVAALKTSQVAALTTASVAAMETQDVASLTTAGVAALTTAQVSQGLTTGQVVALTTAQVVALRTNQVAALTTTNVAALETGDVAVLTTSQVQLGLTTSQFVALTTNQIEALTTRQVEALSTAQVAAITTDQIGHFATGTPLVLDLNGNGISTQSIANGVKFDIFGVDQKVNTGWVTGGDGLLVMDRNHDGSINGGTELFGEGTDLANGQKAANGYVALAELDANVDGVINSSDGNFVDLMVWVDDNADGVSTGTELHSLSSLGITQLGLNAQSSTETDNGNLIGLVSNYTTADGATHEMADVWFATSKVPSAEEVASAPSQPVSLQLQPVILAVDSSDPVVVAADPMRSQVGVLVDAMAAYAGKDSSDPNLALNDPLALTSKTALPTALAGPVVTGMLDAMKQFDANGQPVLSAGQAQSGQVSTTLNTTILRKPDTDILASS
jgi:hypothetical protein